MAAKTVHDTARPSRWYREPLVWLVLAIPATAVIVGVVMLVLATTTWDGLVADDYYRRGMQINRSLARDAEAARLGLGAALTFPAAGTVEVRVTAADGAVQMPEGERLNLHFARAARAAADAHAILHPDADGTWRGALPALPPGKWYVELGNDQWRLTAPVRLPPSSGRLVLRAGEAPG